MGKGVVSLLPTKPGAQASKPISVCSIELVGGPRIHPDPTLSVVVLIVRIGLVEVFF